MDVFLIDKIKDARWFVGVEGVSGGRRKIRAMEKAVMLQVAINAECRMNVLDLMSKTATRDKVNGGYLGVGAVRSDGGMLCDVLERSRKMYKAELARLCCVSFRRIMRYVDGLIGIKILVDDRGGLRLAYDVERFLSADDAGAKK